MKPVTALPTTDTALVLCNIAEMHMQAAAAKMLTGTKDEKKAALKILNTARVEYNMALVKLHQTMKRERMGEGL